MSFDMPADRQADSSYPLLFYLGVPKPSLRDLQDGSFLDKFDDTH